MEDTTIVNLKEKNGISGSTLKLIAIITMLIDHTAATILNGILAHNGTNYLHNRWLLDVNTIMRLIGRLGFPLFCFLLVEGFQHTRNKIKYAIRLAIFAIVSEIPFDLAFNGDWKYFDYQNVFFTLLIGLLVMSGFKAIEDKAKKQIWLPILSVVGIAFAGYYISKFSKNYIIGMGVSQTIFEHHYLAIIISCIVLIVFIILCIKNGLHTTSMKFSNLAILEAGMLAAHFLKTDYSEFGVLTIAVMYYLRKDHFKSLTGGCITLTIMSLFEFSAFATLIPINYYNGKRGLNLKYVFYAFYPVHLFILYLICKIMKII